MLILMAMLLSVVNIVQHADAFRYTSVKMCSMEKQNLNGGMLATGAYPSYVKYDYCECMMTSSLPTIVSLKMQIRVKELQECASVLLIEYNHNNVTLCPKQGYTKGQVMQIPITFNEKSFRIILTNEEQFSVNVEIEFNAAKVKDEITVECFDGVMSPLVHDERQANALRLLVALIVFAIAVLVGYMRVREYVAWQEEHEKKTEKTGLMSTQSTALSTGFSFNHSHTSDHMDANVSHRNITESLVQAIDFKVQAKQVHLAGDPLKESSSWSNPYHITKKNYHEAYSSEMLDTSIINGRTKSHHAHPGYIDLCPSLSPLKVLPVTDQRNQSLCDLQLTHDDILIHSNSGSKLMTKNKSANFGGDSGITSESTEDDLTAENKEVIPRRSRKPNKKKVPTATLR